MCTYGFVIEVQVSGNYRVREKVTQPVFLTSSPEFFRVWGLGSLSMYFVRPAKKDMRFGPDIAGETFSISGPKLQYPKDEADFVVWADRSTRYSGMSPTLSCARTKHTEPSANKTHVGSVWQAHQHLQQDASQSRELGIAHEAVALRAHPIVFVAAALGTVACRAQYSFEVRRLSNCITAGNAYSYKPRNESPDTSSRSSFR